MTDRRALRSNGRVAHSDLQGQVEAGRFTDGVLRQIIHPSATIWDMPGGRRDREVLFGAMICVLEADEDEGFAFGYALRDDYVGYFDLSALNDPLGPATHVVKTRLTYGLGEPDFKTQSEHFPLSLGARVSVIKKDNKWAEIAGSLHPRYVPASHLRPVSEVENDPVTVAERLIGTPYVWGANSSFGIDCSGLIQAGCLACGIACPGDSDQQQVALGRDIPENKALRRGDLLFWKGHVAWVADPETLLHANAHHMAVAYEPINHAIVRINAQGDGPVTARKRLGE